MILIILFICVIFVILLIVFDEDIFFLFTGFSIAIFFIILLIATIAGYNAKGGFSTRNKIILMQEKIVREKKEEVLKESDVLQKKVECVDHLGIASYLSEMIQEIKEAEKEILNKKLQLQEDIMRHNALCNVLFFGLFVIDEKNFGIEY